MSDMEQLEAGQEEVQDKDDIFEEEVIEQSAEQEQEIVKPKIPEKFKDKSVEDIITSYLELEKAYGHRSNEVGEYRKLADQLLEQQLQTKKKAVEQEEEEPLALDSLLENPEETVSKIVGKATKPLQDKLKQYDLLQEKTKFEQKHPDWTDIVQSGDFQTWVTSSPLLQQTFIEADKNFDYAKGAELLSLYKSFKPAPQTEEVQAKQAKKDKALKNATLETAATGSTSKKYLSRKKLMHLRITDPGKYQAMLPEIKLAYSEGRIKD